MKTKPNLTRNIEYTTEVREPMEMAIDYFPKVFYELRTNDGATTVGYAFREADANLWKHAPELLEACKCALLNIKNNIPDGDLIGTRMDLEYAITKAEGEYDA